MIPQYAFLKFNRYKVTVCDNFMWNETSLCSENYRTSKTQSKNIKKKLNLTLNIEFTSTHLQVLSEHWHGTLLSL